MTPSQVNPTYPFATGKPEQPVLKELISKYKIPNILWPLILSRDGETQTYLYERNDQNRVNSLKDVRPVSSSDLSSYFIDYLASPRFVKPYHPVLARFVADKYDCSYDYITDPLNKRFSTVDMDYVWDRGNGFRGFEFTTFYMKFTSRSRAEALVRKINRRPSWKGPGGAAALRKIVEGAKDLNIDYYMVCANTMEGVGSPIRTSGNVYLFHLDDAQIDLLHRGNPPSDAKFLSFPKFLAWL